MTEAQQLRFLEERERNKPLPGQPGPLVMTTRYDQTGRAIYEFKGPKTWMNPYKSRMWLQVRINKDVGKR